MRRLTKAEAKALRDLCTQPTAAGFYAFTQVMFHARKGFRWAHNWHHMEICRALVDVFTGKTNRLIINIPPRYSKTEIAVVCFIAWAMGMATDSEFIHTSYSATLAGENSAAVRDLVRSDLYRTIFPAVRLTDDTKAKDHWKTTDGGVLYAQGSMGTITGFGAGKMRPGFGGAIIIDDPHKASEAASDKVRQGVIDWFQNTLESRKNDPQTTPIILVMQRLHEADLAGFLLAGGNGEEWRHLKIGALQPDGSALWPAKHTAEQLATMKKANPYVFAGQYAQEPAPLDGGNFDTAMIEVVDAIPAGTRFIRAWDMAGTQGGGDYTAGAKLGECPDGTYIIAGMEHFQKNPGDVETAMKNTASADGKAVTVAIPQDPGQAGKAQIRSLTAFLAGYTVTSKPVSGDKIQRASPFAAQVNIGNVKMLRGTWNQALTEELRKFPNAKHDDQVDALSLAFDALTSGNTGLLDYYARLAAEQKALKEAAQAQG